MSALKFQTGKFEASLKLETIFEIMEGGVDALQDFVTEILSESNFELRVRDNNIILTWFSGNDYESEISIDLHAMVKDQEYMDVNKLSDPHNFAQYEPEAKSLLSAARELVRKINGSISVGKQYRALKAKSK